MRRVIPSLIAVPLLLLAFAGATAAGSPLSPFSGSWAGPDPGDGSQLTATFSGGPRMAIDYTDDVATAACADASDQRFFAHLVGVANGDELVSVMRTARCGSQPLPFRGLEITWWFDGGATDSPADDTLTNSFGEVFTRAD